MKYKIQIIAIILLFPLFCSAAVNLPDWRYYKDISATGQEGLYRFSIDDEVFTASKAGLADIRIIDNRGNEIPYLMQVGKDGVKIETYYPKILNNSYVTGKSSTAIIEMEQPGQAINRLVINTDSENFQRNVKIYGSDTTDDWNVLEDDAYIYDYTDKKGNIKTSDTAIDFPESIYRYLKIEISDAESAPVRIGSVQAVKYVQEHSREIERAPQFQISQDSANKATIISIDLGASGIPTNKIRLDAGDANFNRAVTVMASVNQADWDVIGSGYIFRYDTDRFKGENLLINFTETNKRYLKLAIQNKDNAPLSELGITAFSTYREILFQSQGNPCRIYFGNQKANWPQYDIESYFRYMDLNNAKAVTLSAKSDNPQYVPEIAPQPPLSERIPYLLPIAFTIASFALLFLVYKFLQK